METFGVIIIFAIFLWIVLPSRREIDEEMNRRARAREEREARENRKNRE